MNIFIFGEIGTLFFKVIETRNSTEKAPDGYVVMSEVRPDINYIVKDNGNGTGTWIIDKDYYKRINKSKIDVLIQEATLKINILQDTIDLEMTTNGEADQLKAWKRYRILLTRVDTSVENMVLPTKPE